MSALAKTVPATEKKPSYIKDLMRYRLREARRNWQLYLFVAPFILVFITFTVIPIVTALYYGFTYFNVLEPPKFIWWQNYTRMFLADDVFLKALQNTIVFAIITGPLSYMLCLFFAWMINELNPKFRSFMTLLFYAPALANIFVIWKLIFDSGYYGLANGLLLKNPWIAYTFFNRYDPIRWLQDPAFMPYIVVLVLLWSSLGTSFLTFIAALQNVDRSQYEAGAMDGIKNRWQELWYITLPNIKPLMMFAAIMSITASFGIGGSITALVGFPSQGYAVHTIMHHIDDYGAIRFEMGYACAIATFLFLMMLFSNKLVQKFLSKVGD